jgi:hypothetical protein
MGLPEKVIPPQVPPGKPTPPIAAAPKFIPAFEPLSEYAEEQADAAEDALRLWYLFARSLFGEAGLVLASIYPPWLGRPQGEPEKPSSERPLLVPAGYGWL